MTDREKLIELIANCDFIAASTDGNKYSFAFEIDILADHLLANGVTVRQWRNAKADPPPQDEDVLLRFANERMVVGGLREDGGWYANTDAVWCAGCESEPSKWQPLPEPPKEDTK